MPGRSLDRDVDLEVTVFGEVPLIAEPARDASLRSSEPGAALEVAQRVAERRGAWGVRAGAQRGL